VLDDPEDAAISNILFDYNIGGGVAYDSCDNEWAYWPKELYILFPTSRSSVVCKIPTFGRRWALGEVT
jgi:hypothetical protein